MTKYNKDLARLYKTVYRGVQKLGLVCILDTIQADKQY